VNTVRDRIGFRNLQGLVRLNTKNARPEPAPIRTRSGGAVFLEFGEQPVAIAIKKSRQQKRNGQTRFIEASLFLLS